ncbi:MAG: MaoC family dehydratase [Polycyclovorans sp.]|jgi:acyl dehydratase|nr:acyl dehydratase [Polycyclovorans sp.]MBU0789089.1 MaoC family dehydratase [Gammaproteobacteria bacterium]MDP1543944.1 MaoC family dehydratase [Polycyclovorans sp.]|tara:strand:- start:8856 stop:9293 length:438 start_codon:yes stop_codon:yes gene_type:complete
MNFNDFTPGQTLTLGPVSLSEAEIIDFARLWDPQPFHTDPQWAANSRWKGLIASGWQTCALTMRTVCEGPLRDSGSIGSPGLEYLKWNAPVRPGDALTITLDVRDTGLSSSGKVGKLRWQWRVHNQHGALVLDTIATVLFDLAAE